MLKEIWIGKQAMDQMDEEEGYLGWWFLIHCPYSLAHKFNKFIDGKYVEWFYSE